MILTEILTLVEHFFNFKTEYFYKTINLILNK